MSERVKRLDVGNRIRADHRTPQGGARIPAYFSRTGVQDYQQPDGSIRREYRPPEEVFAPASLATFDTAVVVVGHPAMIDATNWKEHAVGDARNAKADGKFTAGDLIIRDQDALDGVNRGDHQEISCGYDCILKMTPGTSPDGEKYDAVQTEIRINHIGLGPANWGRAGSDVRLRLDSGAIAYVADSSEGPRPPSMTPEEIAALKKQAADAEAKLAAEKARADAAEAKLGTQTQSALDRANAQRDEALDRAKKLEEQAKTVNVDALVLSRMAVLDGARILHGKEVAFTGTDKDMMLAAIVARDPSFKADGRSEDYIRSRFDQKVEDAKKANASLGALNLGTAPTALQPTTNNDGVDGELAALIKHFDGAEKYLENYQAAEPWMNGEKAAHEAALKAIGV